MNEPDETLDGECTVISFVHVPADTSKPLQELTWNCPIQPGLGDRLAIHLKPIFNSLSAGKDVDISLLLNSNMTHNFASADAPAQVSETALQQVAQEGSVETFSLVKPTPSNHFVTVNIYLDEAGMLKRLGLNTRATQFATRCGFNPPPTFYGDVFLGRLKSKPYIQNIPFCLGLDTDIHALWLQRATMENLEYQTAMNEITGRTDVQPSKDGEDGIAKSEDGYSWTQVEEELELTISLPKGVASKEISVKFMPQAILVKCRNTVVLSLELFERVDPDGCTWTFDKDSDNPRLAITMEKAEQASWPRIKD
jgi:CS domain